jgi:trimeric autotransporter adhesin
MRKLCLLFCLPVFSCGQSYSQNVGIGTLAPDGKLHIKGTADVTQLIIDANSTQSNTKPLIRLRSGAGTDLLWLHSDHISNAFFGLNAGVLNNAVGGGTHNTFIGSNAGFSNTTGTFNTVTGSDALFSNTTGHSNTANGYRSLYSNTTGNYNTANGERALYFNTTGSGNSANGLTALYHNTIADNNTANGVGALQSNTDGSNNTASGAEALFSNFSGELNTADGMTALFSNQTGSGNTATGGYALYSNNGDFNTANGSSALYFNTTGSSNSASGLQALHYNTTGSFNTAVGFQSLYSTTVSQYNTAIGYHAGWAHNIGYNNTIIGANCDVNANDMFNCIAIGQGVINTANSQARIGNSATNSIGGYSNWTNISDGRFKKDIHENVKGIDFIMKLKPVTYHLDVSGISKILDEGGGKELDKYSLQAISEKEKIIYSGFVAQDVEKAAIETGYDFSGIDKPKNEKDFYGLRYAEFVVPLVKAMQEQQQIIEKQQTQINDLLRRLEALEKK